MIRMGFALITTLAAFFTASLWWAQDGDAVRVATDVSAATPDSEPGVLGSYERGAAAVPEPEVEDLPVSEHRINEIEPFIATAGLALDVDETSDLRRVPEPGIDPVSEETPFEVAGMGDAAETHTAEGRVRDRGEANPDEQAALIRRMLRLYDRTGSGG